ncbi:MAG: threonylcarbamoyl-AMP synthase [Opitutales bacterium]|nr:threonylcarbamoyl-AMP synthase [Opitutales bacterium]
MAGSPPHSSDHFPATPRPSEGVARFYADTESDLETVSELLRAGELVALPTETVYGLAADALNPAACARIFTVKGRPLIDPLIVHVAGKEAARELAFWSEEAESVATAFWPGPLTIVLRKRAIVPDLITAGRPSVALRSPEHPLAREVLRRCRCPLAAPSANPFGYLSPTEAHHVRDSLGDQVTHILDGGPCRWGVESTIVDLQEPVTPRILRPGAITAEDLEAVLGRPVTTVTKATDTPEAPGMLERHYSPQTPLCLFSWDAPHLPPTGNRARVYLKKPEGSSPVGREDFWLSENGSLKEAARHLYALLRRLDRMGFGLIEVEKAPDEGIGRAYNDRLRRAAAKR